MTKWRLFLMTALPLLLFACASAPISSDAAELAVDFTWSTADRCSSMSPKIMVDHVPAGTVVLTARLKDLDVPGWRHGGGEVAYDGSGVIPAGALTKGYNGPCPPSGSHRYQFTVQAVNAEGTIIGVGRQTRNFP